MVATSPLAFPDRVEETGRLAEAEPVALVTGARERAGDAPTPGTSRVVAEATGTTAAVVAATVGTVGVVVSAAGGSTAACAGAAGG